MKGWIFRRYGGPEVLEWADLPDPVAGPGEIVVRVVAAALNPLDGKLREGQFRLMAKGPPRGVGYDYAGVVEAAGPGARRLAPGDAVVGIVNPVRSRQGTVAERVVAPEDLACAKPATLPFTEAAALPGAGITAAQGWREAGLAAGHRVMVVGAAGGVGALAVQLAKSAGAHVTAVASAGGQAFLATLGADRNLDYGVTDWRALPERFDIVFDASGASTWAQCARLLAPRGAYVHTLPGGALIARSIWHRLAGGPRVVPLMEKPNLPDLERLAALAASPGYRSVVTRVAGPEAVPAIQREMAEGHNRGKTVVRLAPDPPPGPAD